ncbi:MAG: DNA/RNA nuclease SfsA [Cellvibrionaceae bacterium]
MKFDPPFQPATLLKRYKRFLTDIALPSGEQTTIHCPNTGSMKQCIVDNSQCWYSVSDNPKRKYPFTWEIATTATGHLAGINTGRANGLIQEAIELGVITELQGYDTIKPEVKYGEEKSRIDFLLSSSGKADCYVEVKSVTLGVGSGQGLFPDAVSTRGAKHLRELIGMVNQGYRAVLVFCVQHTGIDVVSPADEIDPDYGEILREAIKQGVEVIAYRAQISANEIVITHPIPLKL